MVGHHGPHWTDSASTPIAPATYICTACARGDGDTRQSHALAGPWTGNRNEGNGRPNRPAQGWRVRGDGGNGTSGEKGCAANNETRGRSNFPGEDVLEWGRNRIGTPHAKGQRSRTSPRSSAPSSPDFGAARADGHQKGPYGGTPNGGGGPWNEQPPPPPPHDDGTISIRPARRSPTPPGPLTSSRHPIGRGPPGGPNPPTPPNPPYPP